jgi:hypothetical protein
MLISMRFSLIVITKSPHEAKPPLLAKVDPVQTDDSSVVFRGLREMPPGKSF